MSKLETGANEIIVGTIFTVVVAAVVITQNAQSLGGDLNYYLLTLVPLGMAIGLFRRGFRLASGSN